MRLTSALALLAVLLGSACSGSPTSSKTAPAGTVATGAGVRVDVPSGWASREVAGRGLVVAENQADLDVDAASGPRFVAVAASAEIPDAESLLAAAKSEQPEVPRKPESLTIDGYPAVAVEMRLQRGGVSLVSRQVVVGLGPGSAYTLTLEAPEDQWEANKGTLQDILDSVRFV